MSAAALERINYIIENLHTYFPALIDLNQLRSPSISNKALYDTLVHNILVELPKKMGDSNKLNKTENIILLTPETGASGGVVLFNLRPEDTSNILYQNTYDNFKDGNLGTNYITNHPNVLRALFKLTRNDNNNNIITKTQVVYFPEPDIANCLLRISTIPNAPYGYLIYTKKIAPKL